ncbi:hypothetical protein [Arthrobacter sp. A5]|uniref:hypothetical protein n=1 Tax=Arthrobacter sp. A5 TaxID=576926 RepID=UPI003DA9FA52
MSALAAEFVQLLCCAVIVTVSVAATVYALRLQLGRDGGVRGDAVFWHSFLALAFVLPAVIIPAVYSPAAGASLLVLALLAGASAYRGAPRLEAFQRSRSQRRADRIGFGAVAARHDDVLTRWSVYELDVGKMIDYPALSDVCQPETAALVRVMREAALLRSGAGPAYERTVADLEAALGAAELAAGVPTAGQGASTERRQAATAERGAPPEMERQAPAEMRPAVARPTAGAPATLQPAVECGDQPRKSGVEGADLHTRWSGWGDSAGALPARTSRAKVET